MDWLLEFIGIADLSSLALILLIVAAFIAGFIDAVAGGGGLLTVPALLSAGLPPHIALGTNKLAASFGSLTASITFYKKRLFDPQFWQLSILFTAIGSVAGTITVYYVDPAFLDKFLPIIIAISAFYTLFNRIKPDNETELPPLTKQLKNKQSTQGFSLGFYDGFAGPGTGAFWTVSNLALYKINLLLASGVARTMNFVSNFCSLLAFIYLGQVYFVLGIAMGVFLMIGAYVGAHSAIKFGQRFIRPVFILVVAAIAIKLAFDAWS